MFGRALIAVVLVIVPVQSYAQANPTQILQTDSGPVRGKILKTVWNGLEYSAFKGIRYAQPPIGRLRFKPPVEAEPWTEVLDAFEEGSECVQLRKRSLTGNEDCLFLNVFTPQTEFKREVQLRPVMVWIHGGSYKKGCGNSSIYGPDFLMEDGVVLVTMNYRLGALGFLSLQNADVSGNAGLKDQSLAMKWVQRNIAAFGGDPNLVTIFGDSAGGSSVELHRLSPKSKGLFHRTISMSGSPLSTWAYATPREALSRAFLLGKKLGFATKRVDELYRHLMNLSAAEIVLATAKEILLDLYYKPTIEDPRVESTAFLTECPIRLLQAGRYNHVPHMLGFTKDEVITFIPNGKSLHNLRDIALGITQYVPDSTDTQLLDKTIHDLIKGIFRGTLKAAVKIFSGIFFDGPIDLTQRLLTRTSDQPIFYYRQSYESEYSVHKYMYGVNLNGTGHGDDVAYIFNVKLVHAPEDQNHPLNQYRKKMVRLFTNFAAYADPTPNGASDELLGVNWQRSDTLTGWQLDLNEVFVGGPRLLSRTAKKYETVLSITAPLISGCNRK